MQTEDQADVIAFLASPDAHGGARVDRIDTHASIVFIAGDRAWKLKRAVRYDYLDFSTADRRREMCEAEVRLNRRSAPAIYRGVVAVTREADGSLALGGAGAPVDWLVEMTRFDQDQLFDRLAAANRLGVEVMRPLAAAIAGLHQRAAPRRDHGGRAGMQWVIDGNGEGFGTEGRGILDAEACARLIERSHLVLARVGPQLDSRRDAGFVRECHGDLHLRNIVLLDGRPTLFDAIEFNDDISCIDVLYDLAFLLMDLWRRQLPRHANAVWNGYLAETSDYGGASLLPLFLSCRAAVRAKTSATAATLQVDEKRAGEMRQLATRYLAMAGDLLSAPSPILVGIGGFSGSGKSTLAWALGPMIGAVPGAIVLRSDTIRKELCGVSELTPLGAEGYTPEMSRRVYETLAARAAVALRAGQTAIADAVFARESDRITIERVASDGGVPFVGIWLDAPESVLRARAARRVGDASDANAEVIHMQHSQGTGQIAWHHLDASADGGTTLEGAMSLLGTRAPHVLVRDPGQPMRS